MTTPEDVLRAGSRPVEAFDLNGTKIYLRALAFNDYGPWMRGGELQINTTTVVRMLGRAIEDEDGTRLFTDKTAKRLGEMEPTVVMEMSNHLMKLSTLTAEAMEDVQEDFAEAQSGEPSTG